MGLCCNPGSSPAPQSPHLSNEGKSVYLGAVSIQDVTHDWQHCMAGVRGVCCVFVPISLFIVPCFPHNTLVCSTWKQLIYFP